MGFRRFQRYNDRVTDAMSGLLAGRRPARPFDRLGLACLAWFAAFVCLTAVAAAVIR